MLNSNGTTFSESRTEEPPLDGETIGDDVVKPFNAYAAAGTVENELVYVNYGRVEDFQLLERTLGVNVTGKIAIARYGKIFRGDKVKQAQNFGAIGLILYSDPADYAVDGISSVYPDSWWLPGYGVQRGSLFITGVGGDPLTPGYPSLGKVALFSFILISLPLKAHQLMTEGAVETSLSFAHTVNYFSFSKPRLGLAWA